MNTTFYIKLYLATFAAFFIIDMVWLGLVARNLYNQYLGFLMAPNVNWLAAVLFYLLWIAGLLILAVIPGLQGNSLGKAVLFGALFGFMTYATYDLTNLATLKDWPVIITLIDIVWGTVLSTSVASISFLVGRWLLR